jgi:hypothetical protein
MRKTVIGFTLSTLLFALCLSAQTQQPKKVPRIGYLAASDAATASVSTEGIRLALRELGYIEGQSIAIVYRYGRGNSIGSLSLRPNWCVSRLISSW